MAAFITVQCTPARAEVRIAPVPAVALPVQDDGVAAEAGDCHGAAREIHAGRVDAPAGEAVRCDAEADAAAKTRASADGADLVHGPVAAIRLHCIVAVGATSLRIWMNFTDQYRVFPPPRIRKTAGNRH